MGSERYILVTDDEPGIVETYKQYLGPKVGGGALDKLRKLKAAAPTGGAEAAPATPKEQLLPPGWQFISASSGEQALQLGAEIKEKGGEVCVAFFDVKMPPGIDGIETMLRLLKVFPRMRCGIVSAYNDRSVDEINSLFDPAHRNQWDFISKPFTEAEIRQKARMLGAAWIATEAEALARAELADLNASLERLVQERTAALQQTQHALASSEARMKQELTAAASVQMMLFPTAWPSGGALDFAYRIEPSAETGGDICGYLDLGPGLTAAYVCDVTGHGAAAALGTAIIHSSIMAFEHEAKSRPPEQPVTPSEILVRLNQIIRQTTRGSLYASCFVAVIHSAKGRMVYSSAGHEWPLIYKEGRAGVLPLLPAPLLGSTEAPVYANLDSPLLPGDVLLLYTDGLTDAKDARGKPFDRRRLFKAFSAAPRDSAKLIMEAIDRAFREAVPASAPLEDDVTCVVVRAAGG